VSSSSDAPVTYPSWLQGVMAAMRREGRFGGVAGRAERITLREALHTYTSTPAWQDHAERVKGRITPGRVGDVVVLGENLQRVDSEDYVDVPVNATVLAGAVVYDREATASRAPSPAAATAAMGDEHGIRCYEGGTCCCVLTEQMRAGQV
jgi:predicted amidohydrolase YtcJ